MASNKPRPVDYANVEDYGADPSGVADSLAAFLRARDTGKTVFVPDGTYKSTGLLDWANCVGQRIVGANWYTTKVNFTNTTGGMVDFTGSEKSGASRITFQASGTGPEWGLLAARSNAQNYCQFVTLDNVHVVLGDRSGVNDSYGTIAFQNHAAELFKADHCHFVANTPLVDTATRIGGVTSSVAVNTVPYTSNAAKTYANCTFDSVGGSTNGGYNILGTTFDADFICPYFLRSAGSTNYPVRLQVFPRNVRFHGMHVEGYGRVFEVYITDVFGLYATGTFYSDGGNAVNLFGFAPNKAGIQGGWLKFETQNTTAYPLIGYESGTGSDTHQLGVRSVDLDLDDYATLALTAGDRTGLRIRSKLTSPTVSLGADDGTLSALLIQKGATKVYGPLTALGTSALTGNATHTGTVTVNGGTVSVVSAAGAGAVVVQGAASQQSYVLFNNGPGSPKWQIGKDTDNSYFIFDSTGSVNRLHISSAGVVSVQPTSGNTKLGSAAGQVGFYGSAGATKPTVSGSRGSNAALASLLTALSNLGLLTDSSS